MTKMHCTLLNAKLYTYILFYLSNGGKHIFFIFNVIRNKMYEHSLTYNKKKLNWPATG